jgi:hypothetical protein
MCEPRPLTPLWAFTACYRASFTLLRAFLFRSLFNDVVGPAIAQAVSRRLPTAVARVSSSVNSCGICGGRSGTVAGFLRVLLFPLPILIPTNAP